MIMRDSLGDKAVSVNWTKGGVRKEGLGREFRKVSLMPDDV
jgi:hypothetical protein